MNNIIYIPKKNKKKAEKFFIPKFNLFLCFHSKNKKIFKNENMLMSCNKNYIRILVYKKNNVELINDIQMSLYNMI